MVCSVFVLREGHCTEQSDGSYHVNCTITLICGEHIVLVDTGSACDAGFLIDALRHHGLTAEKVDYVVGTHGHSDHIGNLNLFPDATQIVSFDINKGEKYINHAFKEGCPYLIDDDITVEATPGHTGEDVTVFVNSKEYGAVAVAGDIFESEADLSTPELWQNRSQFPETQQISRFTILNRADVVIPGHGALFRVPKRFKDGPPPAEEN